MIRVLDVSQCIDDDHPTRAASRPPCRQNGNDDKADSAARHEPDFAPDAHGERYAVDLPRRQPREPGMIDQPAKSQSRGEADQRAYRTEQQGLADEESTNA